MVTQRTRIVVSSALGGREFEGAQMLEDEIEQWTGWKLKISDAREMPGGADIIYIGDATKDSKLRSALEKQGLSMQAGFDEQGYEISADTHRILVGGASAEGAFNGVQTLRQLLRPANLSGVGEGKSRSRFLGVPTKNVGTARNDKQNRECGPGSENKNNGEAAGRTEEAAEADSSSRLLLGITDADNGRAGSGARFVDVALRELWRSARENKNNGGTTARPRVARRKGQKQIPRHVRKRGPSSVRASRPRNDSRKEG